MDHPPSTCAIELEFADLLWCARGRQWPYALLFKPFVELDLDWEVALWRIFLGLSPEVRPQHVSGTIVRNGVTRAYLATVFLDPVRRDFKGLPVSHRLVWFPPKEESPRVVAPDDWGPRFVAALGPGFDAAFNTVLYCEPDELMDQMREFVAAETKHLPQPLRLEGPAVMVCAQRGIEAWRGEAPHVERSRVYLFTMALLLWAGLFALVALVVFLLRRGVA